jgi:O-antigen/teichoic acid export membrane protein
MLLGYWLMPIVLTKQTVSVVTTARQLLPVIPILFLGDLPFNALQGLGKFRAWNGLRIQFALLWVGALAIAYWTRHRSATFVAFGYLTATGVHCVTALILMARSIPGSYWPDFRRIPALLRYGIPTVASSVPQQLNLRLDQLLMAAFLPAKLLGLYAVAVAVGGAIAPFLSGVSQVMFPHLAGMADPSEQARVTGRALRLSVLVAAPLVAVLLVTTPALLPMFFGKDFRPAVPAALVLILAGGIASLNVIAGECLRGMGLPRLPLLAELTGLGFTVVLLALLLQRYQLMGAAIASLVSYSAAFITYIVLLRSHSGLPLRAYLIPEPCELQYLLERLHLAR